MQVTLETEARGELCPPAKIVREGHIAGTVVVVNGIFGCGKTLLSPIVGALDRVELMRYDHNLEYACILRYLDALEGPVASSLIRIATDIALYNSMMSREVNFRFSDLSSASMNACLWRYVRRLFLPGDEAVVARIERERPILHLTTHMLLGISGALFDALGERLRFIEVIRHPLYMVKQMYKWMPRTGKDPRMFDIWFEHEGESLPWYARGWEELYLRSNPMDRVIYVIAKHWRLGMDAVARLPEAQRSQVLVVPFEQFVLQPGPFLQQLEQVIGTTMTPATRRMMKKQNVPRKMIAEGIGLKIYRHYGWEPPESGTDELKELAKRRAFVESEASPEALETLERLSQEYEAHYFRPQGQA